MRDATLQSFIGYHSPGLALCVAFAALGAWLYWRFYS